MKTIKNRILLFICAMCVLGCSSKDDNCVKIIIVQYGYSISGPYGSMHIPEIKQEVPCDFPEPEDANPIEVSGKLKNFSYEVISFNFTPDTGNNTNRLQFEIKLINPNNYAIVGLPVLTTLADGLQISSSYSNNASSPCYSIDANSSCILTFDKQDSLNLGIINSIQLINVEYFVGN